MDSLSTPSQPTAPQPTANLNMPELPHMPEKLLESTPTRAEYAGGHKSGSWGAAIGIVIILLVLVIGALYFWGAKLAEEESTGFIPEEASATEPVQE